MKKLRRVVWSLALASVCLGGPARAACMEPVEAEGLFLALAPRAMAAIGNKCRDRLPATSLLVRADSPLIARYQAELATAGPAADRAIGKIAGGEALATMTDTMSRDLFYAGMIGEMLKDVKSESCADIDRAITLIEPLPPRNTAALTIFILQHATPNTRGGATGTFEICPSSIPKAAL